MKQHASNSKENSIISNKPQNTLDTYANDPYFVKKRKESKKFLDKYGFPEQLTGKK